MKKKQEVPIYYPIELEDVKLLIGLEVICEPLTKEEWKQKIFNLKQDLHNRTKKIEEDAQQKNEVKYIDMKKISVVIPEPEAKNLKDTLPVNLPDNPLIDTKLEVEENNVDDTKLKKDE